MDNDQRINLRDLSVEGLERLIQDMGERPFRVKQILSWLYRKGVGDISAMTDLSKDLRARLGRVATAALPTVVDERTAPDGTRKLLMELADGQRVESVLIPEEDHCTLCVSTQVGCRQGCRFCRTATMGFRRNLSPAEITGQVLVARAIAEPSRPLTNIVFMGMGEPLDNLEALVVALEHILGTHGMQMSQRKVTVSTVGLIEKLPALAKASPCALAVSVNAPNDEIRRRLMPVARRYTMAELKQALLRYPLKPTRRITLEYVLLKDVNDLPEHAEALARWARGIRCKINLIPFNPHPGSEFKRPEPERLQAFQAVLIARGYTAIIRRSRGLEIAAACGQLAAGAQGA